MMGVIASGANEEYGVVATDNAVKEVAEHKNESVITPQGRNSGADNLASCCKSRNQLVHSSCLTLAPIVSFKAD